MARIDGLPTTMRADPPSRSPSLLRRRVSIEASTPRRRSSTGDLPLEEAPIKACHSTRGSDHSGVIWTSTPAPQTPLTAASRAWTA